MKEKMQVSQIWLSFVLFVFSVMLLSAMLIMPIYYFVVLYSPHILTAAGPFIPIIILFIISIIIATLITSFTGKKVTSPVTELINATKNVAKGDFSVRVSEEHRMSEWCKLTRNFNQMVNELSGIETLRNDFIANVSHEFKTPLAAIEGYATLLRNKDITAEEYDEYTRMIIEAAGQLSTLSGNILKITKLENQQIIGELDHFILDEQIRQAILLLEKQWSEKDMQLDINLDPVKYYGSEELLMQVWLNILGNAIKFTEQGGIIAVHLHQTSEKVIISVSDSGCGMTEDTMKHIYEKFHQGDHTRSMNGNGLGLTLAKRIIDMCHGSIQVTSTLGQGSCFTVSLPISTADDQLRQA